MAKRQKTKAFSFQGFDNKHYRTTDQYVSTVDALFNRATKAIADVATKGTYNPDKPFSFDDYPSVKAYAKKIITGLANNITSVVTTGSRKQWLFACQKNDEFVDSIMDTSKLSKARLNKMQDRNLESLQTFQQRKVDGMNLSQRVWKYTEQYKAQIEMGLDVGLGEGRSAQQLSRDLRQNLQDSDLLFRRVRDKRGNLQLSKSAKAFHPGIGVYRSSAKNAARLTRSEINMAYREADWLRWQQLDFVLGFEVHRSNHEPQCKCKLCERLVGRYPKWFKFKGWHPQCMCFATAILMDEQDFDNQELSDLKSALHGTPYKKLAVKQPEFDGLKALEDWKKDNQDLQGNWGSTPYFIKDNFKGGLLSKGLAFATKVMEQAQLTQQIQLEVQQGVIQSIYNKITQKVIDAENDIRKNAKFETAVMFDEDGNVLIDKRGETTSVAFTPDECSLMKDCVLTHNHPRGWGAKENTIGRIGNSFSEDDVNLAFKFNLVEVRAVTPTYTFSMKRPANGWGMTEIEMKKEYSKIENGVRTQMQVAINKAQTTQEENRAIERASILHYHLVWKRFAKKFDIEYTKTKSVQ